MSSFLTKALPHIIAVVIFLAISIFMYRPIIFEGKVMDQNDINQGKGAASEIVEYREATGEEALWTNSMFGGMPAYLISLRWSGAIVIDHLQKFLLLYLPRPAGENFLAFVTFYILLLTFGVKPYLAIGGAIAFGLSTFFVVSIQAGHMWKIRAIAYMPLVLAGIRLIFKQKYLLGFIITAIALALEINANHLQITYYLFLLLLVYGITEIITDIKQGNFNLILKKFSLLLFAGLLAIGTNFGRLWSTYEYGKYSIRGKSELTNNSAENNSGLDREYAFRWSSGKWESMTLFIPHLYGGASGVFLRKESKTAEALGMNNVPQNDINQYERAYLGYWGNQPGTAGPAYAGAVVCFLFILGIFFVDNKTKYWILTVVLFSIILSWGKNFPSFNNFMFDLFPGYNKFRAVTMIIILALMLIPLMGFFGLEKIIRAGWNDDTKKKLFYATGIAISLALFALLVTSPPSIEGAPAWLNDAIYSDRKSIIRSDVLRTLFYVILTFGILYLYFKEKITLRILSGIIPLLVLLDLGLVDSRYLNDSVYKKASNQSYLSKTPADEKILEDKELDYRVLNLQDPFNEARTSNFHKSIGGYHGAKIRRYQDLISNRLVPEMQQIIKDQKITKENTNVISMLNTKYILAGLQANAVIENPYANGTAWFVNSIKRVNSPDEELEQIGSIDLSKAAVVDQTKFEVGEINPDSAAQIKLVVYQPNYLVYEASINNDGLAVFSEIYYPVGWKAYLGNEEIEIKRANYILRALEVPSGNHKIEFRFLPNSYFIGNKIMLISSLILLAMILYGIFRLWKTSNTIQAPEV